ncbi:hypothetical protein ACYFX5_03315 [Bremerella sp. T1]|uniref:hypothetical protein n=1 Tax=Bremerella sp. TYQ1 TaxID=3119568 RepID=UPI001CCA595E|nr:hypothetical protein [Bremerella volcania]UBM37300.1 hypothetical protein LA756_05270 [Bremerella volcania]
MPSDSTHNTSVPRTGRRFQFGLLSLLALTALCGVVFALMREDPAERDQQVMENLISTGLYYWDWTTDERGRIVHLEYVGGSYDDVWSLEIKKLDALQTLEVCANIGISEYSLKNFAELKSLRRLIVKDTPLTDEELRAFRQQCPECVVEHSFRDFASYADYAWWRCEYNLRQLSLESPLEASDDQPLPVAQGEGLGTD